MAGQKRTVRFGREAGELRNREMANYADGLVYLWDAKSPGTSCMLRESATAGIPIHHSVEGIDRLRPPPQETFWQCWWWV